MVPHLLRRCASDCTGEYNASGRWGRAIAFPVMDRKLTESYWHTRGFHPLILRARSRREMMRQAGSYNDAEDSVHDFDKVLEFHSGHGRVWTDALSSRDIQYIVAALADLRSIHTTCTRVCLTWLSETFEFVRINHKENLAVQSVYCTRDWFLRVFTDRDRLFDQHCMLYTCARAYTCV